MLGAIIGDIAGSRYEFDNLTPEALGQMGENFEIMSYGCDFTDDTVCTVAVADAVLSGKDYGSALRDWCRRYPAPKGGYGGRFRTWIWSDRPEPYGSFGNGCVMRVSPVGFLFEDERTVAAEARRSSAVTHNHEYALNGAELVATAIFRLRHGAPKETAALNVQKAFGRLPEYVPFSNPFDESVMNAVPVAVSCFLASDSFEDAIRRSIIVGGDTDTIGAVVGALAEAHYGIPAPFRAKALAFLPEEMREVVEGSVKVGA